MGEQGKKASLPRVEQTDILSMVFEEVIDNKHEGRWRRFADENPELASEILKQAYIMTGGNAEHQKVVTDIASFVVEAMRTALERREEEAS